MSYDSLISVESVVLKLQVEEVDYIRRKKSSLLNEKWKQQVSLLCQMIRNRAFPN